ncbi:MAG TPA: metallophosphoesterase [bacterium]|nr:metallophosphoesterase [bacterium]HOL48041.1 metallophosphoesterase [bacterium]HPQ19767.1 metallophosphoesterase [bacterium]
MFKYLNWDYLRLKLQERNFVYQRIEDINIGDKVGIIASSHGDISALKKVVEYLIEKKEVKIIFHAGDIMDEHGGAIECLVEVLENKYIYPVLGNHDLLILNKDYIHNYVDSYLELAKKTYNKIIETPELVSKILEIPVKIDTNYFSIVHESVDPPYYAKLTKKKKKHHELGQSVDENIYAVFSGALKHPYFIGSDHSAYILDTKNYLRPKHIKPDTKITVSGSKVISIPSISISKDKYYNCGGVVATINNDNSLTLEFFDLKDVKTKVREEYLIESM